MSTPAITVKKLGRRKYRYTIDGHTYRGGERMDRGTGQSKAGQNN